MANLTDHGANELLDGTPLPATLWVQLHTDDPTDAGTANVAVEDTRQSFTRTAAAAGAAENAGLIQWLSAAADEDLTHVSVWDDESAGDCWFVGAITDAPQSAVTGQNIEIAAGQLTLTFPTW